MNPQEPQYSILIKALLPEEIFDYFEITKVKVETKDWTLFFKNTCCS
ncbi:MAG: hypothetical protein JEY96_18780 [Bacteroidales bacterium]|nr:hypothetical protein [Bacteroidales bacterium]